MHDPVIEDSYQWPTCTACGRNLWATETERWCCRPCQDRTLTRLAELPALFVRLNSTAALVRGARRPDSPTSGSRVPPIPPNLAVLDLAAVGGVATRLQAIEDAWRQVLGWTVTPWRGSPGESVPKQVAFLVNNLPWAADRYDSVGQDIEDIRRLHVECKAALSPDRKPGKVRIGLCPVQSDTGRCGAQLTASTASHRVRCPQCRTEWPDLASWRDLRRAQEAAADMGVAA